VLVNCAGAGYFGPHEEIAVDDIARMVDLNLTAPILLTRQLLRRLRDAGGFIINIVSMCAIRTSPKGCVYAATKAGLRHFGASLFEEGRKSGLKVVNINPDMTRTPFFDHLYFGCTEDPQGYLEPSCVADAVEHCLSARLETVVSEITLQPQRLMVDKDKKETSR
jgi:short-subunit dehydrogenase